MPRTTATHVPRMDHAAAWVARRAAVRFLRAGPLRPGSGREDERHLDALRLRHRAARRRPRARRAERARRRAHARDEVSRRREPRDGARDVSPQTDDSRYAPSQVCTISRSSTPVPGPAHAIVEQGERGHSLEHGVAHHPASVRSHCPAPVLIATWEAPPHGCTWSQKLSPDCSRRRSVTVPGDAGGGSPRTPDCIRRARAPSPSRTARDARTTRRRWGRCACAAQSAHRPRRGHLRAARIRGTPALPSASVQSRGALA